MQSLKKINFPLRNTMDTDTIFPKIVLKDAFGVMGIGFLDVGNASLQYGVFPEEWKISVVIPVAKSNNTVLCEEYRPVNTLTVFEKNSYRLCHNSTKDNMNISFSPYPIEPESYLS